MMLTGIEGPLGVKSHECGGVKLPCVAAFRANLTDFRAAFTIKYPDYTGVAVGDEQETLLRITGYGQTPRRSVASRLRSNKDLFDEFALLSEGLNSVVHLICNIDDPIVRDGNVGERSELLRRRYRGIDDAPRGELLRRGIGIVDLNQGNSVGSPAAFELTSVHVVYDNALIHHAIGDVHLIGSVIEIHGRGRSQNRCVLVVLRRI